MFKKLLEKIRLLFGGYDNEGYDRRGYDRSGYDRAGYDRRGFNKKRKHRLTGDWYDPQGYNSDGFDRDGEHRDYADLKGHRMTIEADGVLQLDLHGMSRKAAARMLDAVLGSSFIGKYHTLVLVHGYSHGNALKHLVRQYEHPGVGEILDDPYNEGVTIYRLKGTRTKGVHP